MSRFMAILAAFTLFALSAALQAQRSPTVAAAANLNFALTEIADQFQADRGTPVQLVFGASGTLTRQIQDGAPFEMFLAADEQLPDQLTRAGLTRDAGVVYATGQLALFAPNGSPLTVDARLDGLARRGREVGVGRGVDPYLSDVSMTFLIQDDVRFDEALEIFRETFDLALRVLAEPIRDIAVANAEGHPHGFSLLPRGNRQPQEAATPPAPSLPGKRGPWRRPIWWGDYTRLR